jgi:multiple sugar transport system ATP-binding protein
MAEVVLEHVHKTYTARGAAVHAVRDISLHIKDGEFLVLVGPSGCGKSTALRMVAGLEDITGGTISIGGRVVNNVEPKDRDIAMVFQNYALYPHMSVRKNMAFALKMRGVPKETIERKVLETAKALGIEELLERKPGELSGGQRQRVAVGRAIVREPKAFLFDEPLSNLDAKLRVTTRAELKALHQRLKTTTIYVTHDQEEAMTLGDRIVVMKDGVIQQAGTPMEVYHHPANQFVAGFVGTPPMNFLKVKIDATGSACSFEDGSRVPIPASRASAMQAHAGDAITLGLRPTMLAIEAQGNHASLPATVEVVEPLGETTDVTLVLSTGQRLVARLPADATPAARAAVRIAPDMHKAHFFGASPTAPRILA